MEQMYTMKEWFAVNIPFRQNMLSREGFGLKRFSEGPKIQGTQLGTKHIFEFKYFKLGSNPTLINIFCLQTCPNPYVMPYKINKNKK